MATVIAQAQCDIAANFAKRIVETFDYSGAKIVSVGNAEFYKALPTQYAIDQFMAELRQFDHYVIAHELTDVLIISATELSKVVASVSIDAANNVSLICSGCGAAEGSTALDFLAEMGIVPETSEKVEEDPVETETKENLKFGLKSLKGARRESRAFFKNEIKAAKHSKKNMKLLKRDAKIVDANQKKLIKQAKAKIKTLKATEA